MDPADLIDFRLKITERTNQVLEALKRSGSLDKNEIAQKVLEDWAEQEIHKAELIQRLVRKEGN